MKIEIKKDFSPSKIVCVGRNYAEHAAELDQPICASYPSQRRYCQRNQQKYDRKHAGCSRDELQRVCADLFAPKIPQEQNQRHQGVNEEDESGETNVFHAYHTEARASRPQSVRSTLTH